MIPKKPDNVIWSDEQWQAIHDDGKNILVSAGAGSGKTAVLTARVIEKLKKGVSLRNLIVLTFTNAAAQEMKERIRKAIRNELDQNESEHLLSEYEYLDQANIQTFDSFALELVRKYHYALNVNRNISILDEALLKITKRKFVDLVFQDYYDSIDPAFHDLIKLVCLKDDSNLKEYILSVDEALDLLVDREEFVASYFEKYFSEEFFEEKKEDFFDNLNKKTNEIKVNIQNMRLLNKGKEFNENASKIDEAYKEIFNCQSYDDYKNFTPKRVTFSRKLDEDIKNALTSEKDVIKAAIDNIKESCSGLDISEQISMILDQKLLYRKVFEIVARVNEAVSEFKEKNNLYTFMDISKMAIKILKDNSDIRDEVKYNTNEIMVDEYQDTSDIQEYLVSLISNNNVYMVGDIKQSIYRFRNANPAIFSDKYSEYKYGKTSDTVIDLSKNFRSRKEVLKNINLLFSKVMDESFGGANYNDGHALVFGNKKYDEYQNENNDFEIYNYKLDKDVYDYKKPEAEAILIAKDIRNKIDSGYKVLDGDKMVTATYKDFCVLTSTKTHFDTFKRVFEMYNIPLVLHKDEEFISSDDIIAVINLLNVVYLFHERSFNDEFKYSLMSLLRSFILEIDDNIISEIMLNENILESLKENVMDVYNNINDINIMYDNLTLSDLVEVTFEKFDIFGNIYKLKNIDSVENRLHFLMSKADELSSISYTLSDFINYFEEVRKNKIDITLNQKSGIRGNVVNMMTIHKSKGLEFNICYFPLLDTAFSLPELSAKILFTKDFGLILPIYNEGLQDSYIKTLLRAKVLREEISEKIRLFYVALTRAKDKFILICKDIDTINSDNSYSALSKSFYKSFYDIIASLNQFLTLYKKVAIIDMGTFSEKEIDIESSQVRVEFRELNHDKEVVGRKKASIENHNLLTKEEKNKMEFGTTIHKYLEVIDINNYHKEINDLNLSDYYKGKLLSFFNYISEMKLDIVNIYHEYEFSYQIGKNSYNGVIDLLIETKDSFIIIDYKLSDIEKIGYVNQLKVYKDYVSLLTDKDVECYLYSIILEKMKKVEI